MYISEPFYSNAITELWVLPDSWAGNRFLSIYWSLLLVCFSQSEFSLTFVIIFSHVAYGRGKNRLNTCLFRKKVILFFILNGKYYIMVLLKFSKTCLLLHAQSNTPKLLSYRNDGYHLRVSEALTLLSRESKAFYS